MNKTAAPQQWFRTYAEIINDPKLLLIAPSDRWYFIGILAMKCSAVLDKTPPEKLDRVICQQLRLTNDEWNECSRRLRDEGLIDSDYQPINWNKRQFKSDTSSDRVRKHRLKLLRNVSETPPETETETEAETDKTLTQSSGKIPTFLYSKLLSFTTKNSQNFQQCKKSHRPEGEILNSDGGRICPSLITGRTFLITLVSLIFSWAGLRAGMAASRFWHLSNG